ncbi:hypothetical protein [Chloroflexus sp.]|uniref:hypothetical protein n=1 Tax=Chloroflexus sp. TaxID=1904827 RepID=UPI002ACE557B|nr:hypothetical protein [Chloroflexus sp.]
MLSQREREALIIGSAIGLAATIIDIALASGPLWMHALAIGIAGSLLCGLATLFK